MFTFAHRNTNNIAIVQLAFLKLFILVAISLDRNDNRRHVHVFYKGNRHWEFINEQITRAFNGEKTISINIEK